MSLLGQGRKAIDQMNNPKLAVKGFVVITDLTRTQVPLLDYEGNSFTPSSNNPFGLTDIIMKNEGTVTGQFSLYCGDDQVAEWHVAPGTSLMLSLNGMMPFNNNVNASSSTPPCSVTVVGVQN